MESVPCTSEGTDAPPLRNDKYWPLVVSSVKPGAYTVYVLPKQLDPEYRKHYAAIAPVTMPITVAERPVAQEFRVRLEEQYEK